MAHDRAGAPHRQPSTAGWVTVSVVLLAAVVFLAAGVFALTLTAKPADRDKATAACFVLTGVGGALLSFALMTGGAFLAATKPTRDRAISRVAATLLVVGGLVVTAVATLGFAQGSWPQRVIVLLPLGAAALCVAEARRANRGYATLVAEATAAPADEPPTELPDQR